MVGPAWIVAAFGKIGALAMSHFFSDDHVHRAGNIAGSDHWLLFTDAEAATRRLQVAPLFPPSKG